MFCPTPCTLHSCPVLSPCPNRQAEGERKDQSAVRGGLSCFTCHVIWLSKPQLPFRVCSVRTGVPYLFTHLMTEWSVGNPAVCVNVQRTQWSVVVCTLDKVGCTEMHTRNHKYAHPHTHTSFLFSHHARVLI